MTGEMSRSLAQEERHYSDCICLDCATKRYPEAETVCRRCKRPTEYQAALCYSCEISLYGDL